MIEIFIGYGTRNSSFYPPRIIYAETKEQAKKKLVEYYNLNNIKFIEIIIQDTIK